MGTSFRLAFITISKRFDLSDKQPNAYYYLAPARVFPGSCRLLSCLFWPCCWDLTHAKAEWGHKAAIWALFQLAVVSVTRYNHLRILFVTIWMRFKLALGGSSARHALTSILLSEGPTEIGLLFTNPSIKLTVIIVFYLFVLQKSPGVVAFNANYLATVLSNVLQCSL